VPERFREVHRLYLETYQQRISDVYATTRHKHNSLEKLWAYLDAEHPEIASAAQVRRAHLLAFVPWAIERGREVQRTGPRLPVGEDRATAHQWLINVRCFFAHIGTWALEDGSPFAELVPPAVPLERHDLVGVGFEKARRRQQKRQVAAILDLEREVPKIRALAARRWQDAQEALAAAPADRAGQHAEVDAFWDWGCLSCCCSPAADRGGVRADHAGHPAPPARRRPHLLPAAHQAVEVRPCPGVPHRRRPRPADEPDHPPRQGVLRHRRGAGL
jgi:hypothetical protein